VLFNEPKLLKLPPRTTSSQRLMSFSALQRAEIAEIWRWRCGARRGVQVSVLFNEPKLLKSQSPAVAEIDERVFQCSSTSRNC